MEALDCGDLDQALINQRAAVELLQQDDHRDLRILAEHPLRFYQVFVVSPHVSSLVLSRMNIGIAQMRSVEHYER